MKCSRCKGKGYYWVSNGPDDCDKEYCDWCDGTGLESMPDPHEPEHVESIIPRVMNKMKGGDDRCFEVMTELTNEHNDSVSNINYMADGVSCSYEHGGKRYTITVKPERLVK